MKQILLPLQIFQAVNHPESKISEVPQNKYLFGE